MESLLFIRRLAVFFFFPPNSPPDVGQSNTSIFHTAEEPLKQSVGILFMRLCLQDQSVYWELGVADYLILQVSVLNTEVQRGPGHSRHVSCSWMQLYRSFGQLYQLLDTPASRVEPVAKFQYVFVLFSCNFNVKGVLFFGHMNHEAQL